MEPIIPYNISNKTPIKAYKANLYGLLTKSLLISGMGRYGGRKINHHHGCCNLNIKCFPFIKLEFISINDPTKFHFL